MSILIYQNYIVLMKPRIFIAFLMNYYWKSRTIEKDHWFSLQMTIMAEAGLL